MGIFDDLKKWAHPYEDEDEEYEDDFPDLRDRGDTGAFADRRTHARKLLRLFDLSAHGIALRAEMQAIGDRFVLARNAHAHVRFVRGYLLILLLQFLCAVIFPAAGT